MNPIPLTWMLLAMLLIAGVSAGAGWHYGGKNVRAEWDAANTRIAQKAAEDAAAVIAQDSKDTAESVKRTAARVAQKRTATEKVIVHVQTLPDPAECALAPERVSNINDAFGVAPGVGGEAAAVPDAHPPEEWEPQRRGAVGGGDGLQLPAVQRPTS